MPARKPKTDGTPNPRDIVTPDDDTAPPLQAADTITEPGPASREEEQFEQRLTSRLVLPHKPNDFKSLLGKIDETRFRKLAKSLGDHISTKVQKTVKDKGGLPDYNPNPYVLMATANVLRLSEPTKLAEFMFGTKLYAGLETSFGRSLEGLFVTQYPVEVPEDGRWAIPSEKATENARLKAMRLSRQKLAETRKTFPWQEIDAACVMRGRRFLLTIKSGPNCINQTMAERIADAILKHHKEWLHKSKKIDPALKGIDIVIGITYGTEKTTSKKEIQVLFKLLGEGFEEVPKQPGMLVDRATKSVQVYRAVGQDFWSVVGNPTKPKDAAFVFLEVLLAVSKGITQGFRGRKFGNVIRLKLAQLSLAFAELIAPFTADFPEWMEQEMTEDEVFWFSAALGSFYDQPDTGATA